jgi:hypothetical protein
MVSESRSPISSSSIGVVLSDSETPTFEVVRIKLRAGCEVKPGMLVKIPVTKGALNTTLIGRVRAAYEHNPNEAPESINVRETLQMKASYPEEEDSTIIYRLIEVDLIEEFLGKETQAPQTLPKSGTDVYLADEAEIVRSLGLATDNAKGLHIGETASGTPTPIVLKREALQRHMFICGTTGSGKSYAMGVVAEEIIEQGIPVIFIDTQDEYSGFVESMGGVVRRPGKDFNIRVSALTESELLKLLPSATGDLQRDIVARAFSELQTAVKGKDIAKFNLADLVAQIEEVGPQLTKSTSSIELAKSRTDSLKRNSIFGEGIGTEDWRKTMYPCLALNCKHLTSSELQPVATAVLRELQNLRLQGHIPPYVAVIDEAHLFVPEGEDSPCKQIIREGVRIGRHHGIAMILMTQSPVDIDKRAIRQCNTRLVFALEPDQLVAIQGVKADASDEMLRALPKMPRGTCLLSGTYESVRHTIPVTIRHRDTPEGGQTPPIFEEMVTTWKPLIDKLQGKGE